MHLIPNHPDDGTVDNPLESSLPDSGWVAYHGTSSIFASSIETRGLNPRLAIWTRDDCQKVCEVYDTIEWGGSDNPKRGKLHGGYPVLRVYVLDYYADFDGVRSLYLSESFARATRYAALPGGETATALLDCLEELVRLEQETDLRLTHIRRLARQFRSVGYEIDASYQLRRAPLGRHPSYDAKLRAIDLLRNSDWLRARNQEFAELRKRLASALTEGEPVVYAVRVRKQLLADAQYSDMGIQIRQPIPPENLLCKSQPAIARPPGATTAADLEVREVWRDRVDEAQSDRASASVD
jgi:hypothetical protein